MNFLRRKGLFEADITGGMLTASRRHEPIFTCRLTALPWFVVHGDGLYAQNGHDALTPLYRGDDAPQLLTCLAGALQAREARKAGIRRLATGIAIVVLALAVWMKQDPQTRLAGTGVPFAGSAPTLSVQQVATDKPDAQGGRVIQQAQPVPQPPPSQASPPADGWALPPAVREALPAKLHSAASRGLFTVPLSGGHARTVYVFADPACPNCQRMERHIETAAGTVNVVIFPVTIEGRDESLKALTPVMALPEAQRAAAWKRLFAADAGIGVPGGAAAPAVTDETQAETARGAIGVNEVAFRAYRLPGTPWTISDDGRYVPQSVLSSPGALEAFLNGGAYDGQ